MQNHGENIGRRFSPKMNPSNTLTKYKVTARISNTFLNYPPAIPPLIRDQTGLVYGMELYYLKNDINQIHYTYSDVLVFPKYYLGNKTEYQYFVYNTTMLFIIL